MSEYYSPLKRAHFAEVAALTFRVSAQHPDAVAWAVGHAATWHDAVVEANARPGRDEGLWSLVEAHEYLTATYFSADADAGDRAGEVITAALYLYRNSERFAETIRVYQVSDGDFAGQYRVVIADGQSTSDKPLLPVTGERPAAPAYTYRLPTDGYIILHQVQRDGEPPNTVTRFIDSANLMTDAEAIAFTEDEHASLRSAPTNVVHTLRLIHRTTAGDRGLWTGEPVRGAGPPLA